MNDDNGHRVSPDDYRHSAPWNASYSYGEPDAHSSSTAELSLRRTTNELRVAHELRKRLRMDKRRQTPPRVFTSGADEIAPCDEVAARAPEIAARAPEIAARVWVPEIAAAQTSSGDSGQSSAVSMLCAFAAGVLTTLAVTTVVGPMLHERRAHGDAPTDSQREEHEFHLMRS